MRAWLKKHNVVYWILSLVLAVMFWLYVGITQDIEIDRTYNITPIFTGVDTLRSERDIVVVSGITNVTMTVTLRGKLSDLALCNPQNIGVTVRLNNITTADTHNILPDITLPEAVGDRPRIIRTSRRFFTVVTDKIEKKDIDVHELRNGIKLSEGYRLRDVQFDPPQIKVSGPSEQLKNIVGAQVAPIKEGLDSTSVFAASVTLVDADGNEIVSSDLTYEPEEVMVTLLVLTVKDVKLQVDLVEGGGAQARHVIPIIDPPSIQLTGDPAVLDPINSVWLDGSINLADVVDGDKMSFPILIPNDVEPNIRTEAEVTVHFIGLATKSFITENIEITGSSSPEGMEVRLIDRTLALELRGPEASIDRVEGYNIRVVVDLADANLAYGQQNVKAKVSVDGFPDVGAIGNPMVAVELVDTLS